MKNVKIVLTTCILLLTFGAFSQSGEDYEIISRSKMIKKEFQTMDTALNRLFTSSSGYAIFPKVGEGSLIVGGASGNGVLYENGSMIGMASLLKLDIGMQAGGQYFAEVIFFKTNEALNNFKEGEFEFSAEASAIALEKGVAIKANYDDDVIVIVKPEVGIMADLSVGAQKFEFKPMKNL